jgi:hypothetical protein
MRNTYVSFATLESVNGFKRHQWLLIWSGAFTNEKYKFVRSTVRESSLREETMTFTSPMACFYASLVIQNVKKAQLLDDQKL